MAVVFPATECIGVPMVRLPMSATASVGLMPLRTFVRPRSHRFRAVVFIKIVWPTGKMMIINAGSVFPMMRTTLMSNVSKMKVCMGSRQSRGRVTSPMEIKGRGPATRLNLWIGVRWGRVTASIRPIFSIGSSRAAQPCAVGWILLKRWWPMWWTAVLILTLL